MLKLSHQGPIDETRAHTTLYTVQHSAPCPHNKTVLYMSNLVIHLYCRLQYYVFMYEGHLCICFEVPIFVEMSDFICMMIVIILLKHGIRHYFHSTLEDFMFKVSTFLLNIEILTTTSGKRLVSTNV